MPDSIAVVERVLDALNRSDFDAVAEASTEDFELDFSNSLGPMSGIYRGRDGAKEFLTSFSEAWAALEFESEETRSSSKVTACSWSPLCERAGTRVEPT